MRRLAGGLAVAAAATLLLACANDSSASRTIPDDQAPPALKEARQADPERYAFAVDSGATFVLSPNRKAYSVQWTPPGRVRGTLVTLHGDTSTAVDQFFLWQRIAARRGLRLVSIQWTYGSGQKAGRYDPAGLYRYIAATLKRIGVKPGTAILHGFSTAAIRTYALAAYDRRAGRYFGLIIANSGSAFPSFPENRALLRGAFGSRPLAGTRWAMFCGGKDPNPQYSGCPSMRRSATFVRSLGGRVVLFIADRQAGHGGLLAKPGNADRALSAFRPAR